MNVLELIASKRQHRKLTMVTCYDSWSAKILNDSDVDMLLVGDSSAMVMHGFETTIPATVEMICTHVAAVRRGADKKFIIADVPFLANRSDLATNMRTMQQLMQAGAHALKIEGFDGNGELVRHVVQSGIPVMGHLGLTPQSVHAFGGFRVQGRGEAQAKKVLADAHGLQEAGCFALVLECVPGNVASEITGALDIPTIGIGAGAACDGQVLVLQDLLGLTTGFKAKFVRPYLNGAELLRTAVNAYCGDVTAGKFPSESETYD